MTSGEIELAEWVAAGQYLGKLGRCSQWWIGDWIRYGNTRFGERYARAAKITGYDVQTLTNMVYVASRFEISRRRENLSWSHHETLAALEVDQQEHWLNHAVAEKLSVSDLRMALRTARLSAAKLETAQQDSSLDQARSASPWADGESAASAADVLVVVCPRCGDRVPIPEQLIARGAIVAEASIRRGGAAA